MNLKTQLLIGFIALFLSGCSVWGNEEGAPPLEAEITPLPESTPTVVLTTPTQVVVVLEDQSAPKAESNYPTPAPDPLVFTFPESEPPPVSAWRPALYSIPLALTPYDHFYFDRPIDADEVNWPLDNYRYGGSFFEGEVHTGIDITAPPGTPVIAAGDGKVVWAGWGLYRGVPGDYTDPYGLAVVIQHDFGYQGIPLHTVYAHLQQVLVPKGQYVSTGDLLGLLGDTGRVTGPHLHFEIRWGERTYFSTVNPELWLAPPEGWGVIAGQFYRDNGKELQGHQIEINSIYTGQVWYVNTYTDGVINRDPYYNENFVVSDLPAGLYQIELSYAGKLYSQPLDVHPGRVNFLAFYGRDGFNLATPVPPGVDFDPTDSTLDN